MVFAFKGLNQHFGLLIEVVIPHFPSFFFSGFALSWLCFYAIVWRYSRNQISSNRILLERSRCLVSIGFVLIQFGAMVANILHTGLQEGGEAVQKIVQRLFWKIISSSFGSDIVKKSFEVQIIDHTSVCLGLLHSLQLNLYSLFRKNTQKMAF